MPTSPAFGRDGTNGSHLWIERLRSQTDGPGESRKREVRGRRSSGITKRLSLCEGLTTTVLIKGLKNLSSFGGVGVL